MRRIDPLCNVLAETFPDAEIILMGVEELTAAIHAPNESVDPSELAAMATAEAMFLQRYPASFVGTIAGGPGRPRERDGRPNPLLLPRARHLRTIRTP